MDLDTSLKTLRDYSKARLDILKQLRDADIQQEVELPRIVAVGIQSVGKSSVIEAISTLKLPRGVGTCTKCPMEFRLEHSGDSPSFDKDEVAFRSNLSDLNEIRRAIAEAQEVSSIPVCLVCPAEEPQRPQATALALSPKTVPLIVVQGVIEDVSDGQDPTQIGLIKNLVKKYVSKPNCIVLLVVSCEYDLEIGGVARLIFTDSDPELKARTVGVLTKVDRIVDEMGPTWLETFNNKTRKLDNGWFAVKLPAGGDLSWDEARKQEREFFRDNEPWKSIPGEDRNRLGSEQLTQYISKLLSTLVAARLPEISREITDIIDACDAELEHLPLYTERNAYDTVLTVIDKFSTDFSAHIQGISPKPFTTEVGLIYQVKKLNDTIRHGVSKHTPRFCPTNKPNNGTYPESSPALAQLWAQLGAEGEVVYLDQMTGYIKRAVTRELPGELPYGIVPRIITHFVQSWQEVAITVFRNVRAVAVDHFNALVWSHFGAYERGGLLSRIKGILDKNIDHCATVTVAELKELAAMELVPSTVLKTEYTVLQTTIYQQYQPEPAVNPAHEMSLWSAAADIFEAFLLNNSATIVAEIAAGVVSATTRQTLIHQFETSGQHDHDPNVTNLNDPTENKVRENALTVMSRVQAYLELASKRFEDVAANCIDHSFLQELDKRVRKALLDLPTNTSPEMYLKLIQDPTVAERRRRITEKRQHYASVKNILDDARRDLGSDAPDLYAHAGSQQTAPNPHPQSNSESEVSYSPLSVDCSSPSLTEIDVADSQ
ncbi:P-loop containing nucleoside triphosphate hydrolase protein [Mycena leptocephala]|nr:P-loop containing nucleoside triphosphate hydrolase protein [Mycena leptocephala]